MDSKFQSPNDPGYFYVIELYPQLKCGIFKVGFTIDINKRIRQYKTTAPRLKVHVHEKLLRKEELNVIKKLRRRYHSIGREVFVTRGTIASGFVETARRFINGEQRVIKDRVTT